MSDQMPSIGRVVHYHSYGTPGGEYLPEPRAAIITGITAAAPDGSGLPGEPILYTLVSLCVLSPTGMFFNDAVPFSSDPIPGHWSWPPRV